MNVVVDRNGKIFIRSTMAIEVLRKQWPEYTVYENLGLTLPDDRYEIRGGTVFTLPLPGPAPEPTVSLEEQAQIVLEAVIQVSAENVAVFAELDDPNWDTLTDEDREALHLFCRALADIKIFKGYTDQTKTIAATLPSVPEILQ